MGKEKEWGVKKSPQQKREKTSRINIPWKENHRLKKLEGELEKKKKGVQGEKGLPNSPSKKVESS